MTEESVFAIRLANPADLEVILGLLTEATAWLRDKGTDQWQGSAGRSPQVRADIAADLVWVVEWRSQARWPSQRGPVVASITVDERADPAFWGPEDGIDRALYCHRMVVDRRCSGMGLGVAMLDWAAWRARCSGRELIRLDAWSTNEGLHHYYKGLSFDMVRNDPVPGRGSGALFERPTHVGIGEGPMLVRVGRWRRPANRDQARPTLPRLMGRLIALAGPVWRDRRDWPSTGATPYLAVGRP